MMNLYMFHSYKKNEISCYMKGDVVMTMYNNVRIDLLLYIFQDSS